MDKKIIFILLGAVILGLVIFGGIQVLANLNQGPASLKITSIPSTTIFLDSQQLGKTPYEGKTKAGEYNLKLIPDSGTNAASWETKIKLAPGVLTFINHEFGDQDLTSAGEILTLEKISGSTAEIAVLSTPDGATVSLDSTSKGTTPLVLKDINPGEHEINISAAGFTDRGIKVMTTAGFKLVVSFQLALATTNPPATPSASPSPSASPGTTPKATPKPPGSPAAELPRPYVKILDTPTGFLRVRVEPSTSATEAAQIKPGETYPLLGEQSGWYKIKYQGESLGWIAGQYAEKFE